MLPTIRTGVDMELITRMEKSVENPRFLQRVFSVAEQELYRQRGNRAAFLTGNFCAKEAFSKALGTGIRGFSLPEVEVLRDTLGAPYFRFSGRAQQIVAASGLGFSVSISNTAEHAVAFVVAYCI